MSRFQTSYFEGQRLTLEDSLDLTRQSLLAYADRYQPPASDRPSGAARKRLRWSEQAARSKDWRRLRLLGQDPTPPKAGIPRGRQGVKRG